MIKNLIVVLIAVISIFSCSKPSEKTSATATAISNVVYINLDTLLNQYNLYLDNKAVLEDEYSKAEKSIGVKLEAYQKKVGDFQQRVYNTQQKANELSPVQLQALERRFKSEQESLALEEQDLVQQRDVAAANLDNKMVALQADLKERIDQHMEEISKAKGYDYILIKGNGGGVLYGNAAFDITDETVKELNAKYDKSSDNLLKEMSEKKDTAK